jgi:predicted AlkP superfamily phosphohydrolase/phosphomutase
MEFLKSRIREDITTILLKKKEGDMMASLPLRSQRLLEREKQKRLRLIKALKVAVDSANENYAVINELTQELENKVGLDELKKVCIEVSPRCDEVSDYDNGRRFVLVHIEDKFFSSPEKMLADAKHLHKHQEGRAKANCSNSSSSQSKSLALPLKSKKEKRGC